MRGEGRVNKAIKRDRTVSGKLRLGSICGPLSFLNPAKFEEFIVIIFIVIRS